MHHFHPWPRCHPRTPSRTTRPCSCLQVYRQSISYHVSTTAVSREGPESFSRCKDQRLTNKSGAQILHPVAYARTCRTRFRLLRTTHSTENPRSKSGKPRMRLLGSKEYPPRIRHCKLLPRRLPWHYKSVSVTAAFRYMNRIPGQRGHIDECVRFVMRGDVVNSVFGEIRRTNRRIPAGFIPDRTRRPSASVLSTSTDLPFIA